MWLEIQGWVRDLNEVHLDHLGSAWGHWRRGLRSPELNLRQLRRFEARIEAHVDALVLAKNEAEEELQAALVGELDEDARAAADALACGALGDGAERLLEALLTAKTPARKDTLLHAMQMRPRPALLAALERRGPKVSPVLQLARRLARAAAGKPTLEAEGLGLRELRALDGAEGDWAWRATASEKGERLERAELEATLAAGQPARSELALAAAFARGESWALDVARSHAKDRLVAARWLAALGSASDFELLVRVANDTRLGPERFLPLASLGDPRALPVLLEQLSLPRPADSSAAAWAFRLLAGVDVHSLERVPVPEPSGALPDAFDQLFLDEVFLPDLAKARAWLERDGAKLEPGPRWRNGVALDAASGPALDSLDVAGLAERAWRRRVSGGAAAAQVPGSSFPFVP